MDKPRILIVDDEKFNRDLLRFIFDDSEFDVTQAEDGKIALEKLAQEPAFDAILLDRMMPNLGGMEVLKTVKADKRFRDIPVIMQTAAGRPEEVQEGIQAGAYYYLVKPYKSDVIREIVIAALQEARVREDLRKSAILNREAAKPLNQSTFQFRTTQEAEAIASHIANRCPNPQNVLYGLDALMTNAIEHGNLHMSYENKAELVAEDRWNDEVARRAALPENARKFATLKFDSDDTAITITISDQGKGFNWKRYMDFDPIRMTEPHGRGIAMTNAVYIPSLKYQKNGTEVVCHIPLQSADKET